MHLADKLSGLSLLIKYNLLTFTILSWFSARALCRQWWGNRRAKKFCQPALLTNWQVFNCGCQPGLRTLSVPRMAANVCLAPVCITMKE
jgi:hypothetical protein